MEEEATEEDGELHEWKKKQRQKKMDCTDRRSSGSGFDTMRAFL